MEKKNFFADIKRPMSPFILRSQLQSIASNNKNMMVSKKVFDIINSHINHYSDDVLRKLLYWFLFGDLFSYELLTSKKLTGGQRFALLAWIDFDKVDFDRWIPNKYFQAELYDAINAAIRLWKGEPINEMRKRLIKEQYDGDSFLANFAILLGGNYVE